jgi:hypothetical protein
MYSQATAPQAAPAQGAAPTAAARLLATLAALDAAEAAAKSRQCRNSYAVAPPLCPEQQQYEPSTDPTRYQGFI